jgi:aspartate racemase
MDVPRRPFVRTIRGQQGLGDLHVSPAGDMRSTHAPLRIEQRLYAQIVNHLQQTLPVEGCGLVAFDSEGPVKVYPGTNVLRSDNRYRMDDLEVLRAVDDMDRHGWVLGAIYHSHPSSPALPSATDLREATWPDALMLIVSLMHGVPELRAFRVMGHRYEELGVEVYSARMPWLTALRARSSWLGRGAREQSSEPRRPFWQPVGAGRSSIATSGSDDTQDAERGDGSWNGAHDRMRIEGDDDPERRAVIGILGGMGPLATADLYRKIIETTPAAIDQEHIPVVIYADPRVPDRTDALLHGGEDPTPWLVSGARALSDMGADFIIIPCNTAHAFVEQVRPAVDRPILSMIDAAADEIRLFHPNARTVGLLATSGTISAELYQRALQARGIDVIVPDDDVQRRCVMAAIKEVKSGRGTNTATLLLVEASEHLVARGADLLLEACTEIPIALQQRHVKPPLLDATAALARTAVATARHLDESARAGDPQWETTTWQVAPVNAASQ